MATVRNSKRATGREIVPISQSIVRVEKSLLEPAYFASLRNVLPSAMSAERFVAMAAAQLRRLPHLAECTLESWHRAVMDCAELALPPNGARGQAFLIPYWNSRANCYEVRFQVGYKGLRDLAYRNPRIKAAYAETVFENDVFEYQKGTESRLVHKPLVFGDRGELIGYYAVALLDGGHSMFQAMSKGDVVRHRDMYVPAWNKPGSAWVTDFDAMALKTVFIKLYKWLPCSPEMEKASLLDTEADRGADYSIPHKVDDSLAVDVTGWEEVHSEDASTHEHHEHIDSATGLESRMAVSDPEPQPEPKPEPPKRRRTRARVEQKSDDELVLEGLRNRLTDLARNAPLSRLERAARAVAGDDFNDDYQALSEAQLREVIALMEKK